MGKRDRLVRSGSVEWQGEKGTGLGGSSGANILLILVLGLWFAAGHPAQHRRAARLGHPLRSLPRRNFNDLGRGAAGNGPAAAAASRTRRRGRHHGVASSAASRREARGARHAGKHGAGRKVRSSRIMATALSMGVARSRTALARHHSRRHPRPRHPLHGPHVHRDGPVGLHHLLPDRGEDDLAVGGDQVVVALLHLRTDNLDVQKGLLDELLHTLSTTTVSRCRRTAKRGDIPSMFGRGERGS